MGISEPKMTVKSIARHVIRVADDAFAMDTSYQSFLKNLYTLRKMQEDPSIDKERLNAQVRVVNYEWVKFVEDRDTVIDKLERALENLKHEKYNTMEAN